MITSRPRVRALVIAAATVALAAGLAAVGGATTTATAPSNTALPSVSGTAQQGQTLTSSSGSWSGTTPISFAYSWDRCDSSGANCAAISGAAEQTYTVAADDVGHKLRAVVKASNSAGSASASSGATSVVTAVSPPQNTGRPQISGSMSVGATLTTTKGTWTGSSPIGYQYQWRRCDSNGASCGNISNAIQQSYTIADSDNGRTIRVVVTATNAGGSAQATSDATAKVAIGVPRNTTEPVITGTVTQGQTLTVSNGVWSSPSSITYSYSWQRCDTGGNNCASISGATSRTYVLTSTDVGSRIRAIVTATNSAGPSHATANLVGPVVAPGPTLPAGAIKLSNGEISVPASSIPDSDRLTLSSVAFSPSAIQGHNPVTATFKVIDTNKYVIRDALVYVLGLPRNWAAQAAEQPTAQDGTARIIITPTSAAPGRGALVLFVRARTPQGNLLAGSSTRRLVQVRITR